MTSFTNCPTNLLHLPDDLLWRIGQEADAKRDYNKVVDAITDLTRTMEIADYSFYNREYRGEVESDYYGELYEDLFECSMVYRSTSKKHDPEDGRTSYDGLYDHFVNTLGDIGVFGSYTNTNP